MGDLISRKRLLEDIEGYNGMGLKQQGFGWYYADKVKNQPTAFDLESMIAKIKAEENRQLIELEETLKNADVDNNIVFLTYNAVLVTLDSAMALIKSVTNGEIGG